jgi:hypothetical protein
MTAHFVQDCSKGSPLLDHYAEKEYTWPRANLEIIRAVAETGFRSWFPFSVKNLTSTFFKVQKMVYEGSEYAVVTNSAINYIFLLEDDNT